MPSLWCPAPADSPHRVGLDGRSAPPGAGLCDDVVRDKTSAWLEESVAEIRSKAGGKRRARVKDGLVVAVLRHYESRATESRPLLHDHAVVSIRARRPDDKVTWGNLEADSLMAHIVAVDTLHLLYFMEEVSARLGWAWEPREVTPGRQPVIEIAGIDQRLIGWQSTRRQQIEDALPVLTAKYEEQQGHAPGERASYALACQAAHQTRPPKRTELLSLTELRERWRTSAIRALGAIAGHMRTGLVADALRTAAMTRGGLDGSVFHSDHGAQYASRAFAGLCDQLGGHPVDGSGRHQRGQRGLRELHASLKRETLRGARDYGDAVTCRRTVFAWLPRYNTRRWHSTNGHSTLTNTNADTTRLNSRSPRDHNRVSTITGEGPGP